MKTLVAVGVIGLALAAIIIVVVRELRRRTGDGTGAAAERATQRQADEVRCRAKQEQEEKARRCAESEVRVATEEEADRQFEEEAGVSAEQEAQRQAEKERGSTEKEARIASKHDAEDEPRCREEEEARGATDQEDGPAGIDAEAGRHQRALRPAAAHSEATGEALEASVELGDPAGATIPAVADQLSAALGAPAMALRASRQYRPKARVPAGPRAVATGPSERDARERAMPIEVRLVFETAGFCRVSLLPRRASDMPVEFPVTGSANPPELLALQDEWYQDLFLPDMDRLLKEGIEWAGPMPNGRTARLSLSGRELYVLARHNELNGFVSTPRLILGEEHVVLCVAGRLPEVYSAIVLTDSPEPTVLYSDRGIPAGWIGLRGVFPRRPITPSPDGDILDALRPLSEVEIALRGGIRIDRQTWLSGFPPVIRLRGDTSTIGAITIDGQAATLAPDGGFVAPGWDLPGEHSVWCTSKSRTFAIRGGAEEWEPWDAYRWSFGEPCDGATQSRPAICGVFVRPPGIARSDSRVTVVAASNPVLIGARPGEIEICAPRRDVRAGLCVGFPWFEPIWAMPTDALHCDKRTARVLLIGPPRPVAGGEQQTTTRTGRRVSRHRATERTHSWCTAILAAGRKGLRTDPSRAEIAGLWKLYKRFAKALRRSWR